MSIGGPSEALVKIWIASFVWVFAFWALSYVTKGVFSSFFDVLGLMMIVITAGLTIMVT